MSMGFFVSDYALKNDTLDRLGGDGMGIILVANIKSGQPRESSGLRRAR
jgi:hypothetical protein